MAQGLTVNNASNGVQIDATYRNYSFWASGMGTDGNGDIAYPATSGVPIIATRPPHLVGVSAPSLKQSGSSYVGASYYFTRNDIAWAVFTEQLLHPLPTYGLVVYNNAGQIVFSSGEKYLKIYGSHTFNFPANSHQDISVQDAYNHYFLLFPVFDIGYAQNGLHWFPLAMMQISQTTLRILYGANGNYAENDANITSDNSLWPWGNGTLVEVGF